MSKSFLQLVCPVTSKRERVPVAEVEDGVFVPVEDEDDATPLPAGWGRITVERVVRNPEVELMRAARREALAEMNAEVERQSQDEANPQAAQIRAEIESGEAARQIQEVIEARYPTPEQETLLLRASFYALSDEAMDSALTALEGAGFTFSGLEEA